MICSMDKWEIFNQYVKIRVNAHQLYTLCYFVYVNISSLLFPCVSSGSLISAIHPAWGSQGTKHGLLPPMMAVSQGAPYSVPKLSVSRTQGLPPQPPDRDTYLPRDVF